MADRSGEYNQKLWALELLSGNTISMDLYSDDTNSYNSAWTLTRAGKYPLSFSLYAPISIDGGLSIGNGSTIDQVGIGHCSMSSSSSCLAVEPSSFLSECTISIKSGSSSSFCACAPDA